MYSYDTSSFIVSSPRIVIFAKESLDFWSTHWSDHRTPLHHSDDFLATASNRIATEQHEQGNLRPIIRRASDSRGQLVNVPSETPNAASLI